MGLRGRLLLTLVVPTAFVAVLAGLLVHRIVSVRGEEELARTLDDAEVRTRAVIARRAAELDGIARALADPEGVLVAPLAADLVKGGGRLPALARLEHGGRIEAFARGLGLYDVTVILGDGSASPATRLLWLPASDDPHRHALTKRSGIDWRRIEDRELVLVELASATGETAGAVLTVLLGRRLGDALDTVAAHGVTVRLLDAGGLAFGETPPGPANASRRLVPLFSERGEKLAHVELGASRLELARLLRALTAGSLALGAIAVAGAALLALALARRIGRELDVRTAGAEQRASTQMTTELRDSKARLRQAERLAAWQEIARALAHELKNPLTPIRISVETLRKAHAASHASFPELFDESTRTILEEVKRMEKSLREFAEFARLPRRERQLLDLNEVVGGALALYKGAVRVVEELAPRLPPIDADRDQLTQVVLNLLENARDAVALRGTEQTVGRIHVTTRAEHGGVVLEIKDNGPGFDDAIAEQLFTPYFTTKAQGTGLGLAIVQRIVVEHGGTITAHGEPGEGACFTIELPLRGGVTDTVPVMPPRTATP